MKEIGKAIFNLQRFQILQVKANLQTQQLIPDHYAYAWQAELYPALDESALHEDLEPYFTITRKQVDKIKKYADDEWLKNKLHSFYEFEDHFGCRSGNEDGITRDVLIKVFRYMYLKKLLDDAFWKKLLETAKFPTEASVITQKLKEIHIAP